MPRMIRQPRRGMKRLTVIEPYVETAPVEIRPVARRGLPLAALALVLLLAVQFVPGLFEEETARGGRGPAAAGRGRRRPGGTAAKEKGPVPVWKRFGSGVGAEGARVDATTMKAACDGLAEMAAFLPTLGREKTVPENFKDRAERFAEILRRLPASTRESLFKGVTAEALLELYQKAPEKACALLDRLFAQSRIILS